MRNGYSITERTAATQNPEVPSMQLRRSITRRHQHVSEEESCCLDTVTPTSRAATPRTPECLLMPGRRRSCRFAQGAMGPQRTDYNHVAKLTCGAANGSEVFSDTRVSEFSPFAPACVNDLLQACWEFRIQEDVRHHLCKARAESGSKHRQATPAVWCPWGGQEPVAPYALSPPPGRHAWPHQWEALPWG